MDNNEEKEINAVILCIGYISVYMNTFELLISQLNKTLLNFSYNEFADLLIGKKTISEKIDLTKKLLQIIPFEENLRTETIVHLNLVNKIREERNKYIHGYFHTIEEEGVLLPGLYIKSIRNWDKNEHKKIDLVALDNIKLEILRAVQLQEQINIKLSAAYHKIQSERKIKAELLRQMFKNTEPYTE